MGPCTSVVLHFLTLPKVPNRYLEAAGSVTDIQESVKRGTITGAIGTLTGT